MTGRTDASWPPPTEEGRLVDPVDDLAFEAPRAPAVAPGFYLRIVLANIAMSQAQLALRAGLSTKHVNQLAQGLAPLSPDTALLFERATGVASRVWNGLEARYQEHLAQERSLEELEQHTTWLTRFPLQRLRECGHLTTEDGTATQVAQVLHFFRVASPATYEKVWSAPVASGFRRANHLPIDHYATATWLRLAELEAQTLTLREFNSKIFAAALPALRSLTLERDDATALRQLQEHCAELGVAVVFVAEVTGARTVGAARWLDSGHPMIVLSGRYKYADIFWFCFFHEAAHLVLHGKRETYIDLPPGKTDDADGLEAEANRAAARYLVGAKFSRNLQRGMSQQKVRELAHQVGVDVGIVAGQVAKRFGDWGLYAGLRRSIDISAHKT